MVLMSSKKVFHTKAEYQLAMHKLLEDMLGKLDFEFHVMKPEKSRHES